MWWNRRPSRAEIPWAGKSDVVDAWSKVKELATSRGRTGPWNPDWSPDRVDLGISRIQLELPPDLIWFFKNFSIELWLEVINPSRMRLGDGPQTVVDVHGNQIAGDHPDNRIEQEMELLSPDDWEVVIPRSSENWPFEMWRDCVEEGDLDSNWLQTSLLSFAHTLWGDEILWLSDTVGPHPIGSIAMTTEDDACVYIVAHSVGEWIHKLVACGGFEAASTPGSVGDLPRDLRGLVRRDFKRLNPGSNWLS